MTSRNHDDGQLERAESLARRHHADHLDKSGAPYWEHCRRVAAKLTSTRAKTVAWLHDVLEDTDLEERALRGQFDDAIVDAVVALTRIDGEAPEAYYARVRANALAREVKLADIHDNLDPSRLALLSRETAERLIAKMAKRFSLCTARRRFVVARGGRPQSAGMLTAWRRRRRRHPASCVAAVWIAYDAAIAAKRGSGVS